VCVCVCFYVSSQKCVIGFLFDWTNCAFGLYPSSDVSKNKQNWGIKNIDKMSQYTRPQISHKDQLLTTEQLTRVHTHMNPSSKSDTGGNKWPSHCTLHTLKKPRKHKNCIQTKAHAHPLTPWNTRSQGKKPRWQLVTQLLTDHNTQGGPKYQYKICTNTQWHTNTIAYKNNDTTFRKLVLLPLSGILYWYFGPPCVLWSVSSCVTNCHLGFFPWLLVFQGVCGCACALVFMQFLCFLGF
jgi:hypothetical protein